MEENFFDGDENDFDYQVRSKNRRYTSSTLLCIEKD